MSSLMFPSVGKQVLSSLIHFLGVSVLSHCLSRRLAAESWTTIDGLRNLSWPRICVVLVFLDSWLFLFTSGVLIFGVGLELHPSVCAAGTLICILFYATSKLLIYAFLIERVYIVWTPATGVKRFKSPIYILCFVTVCVYAVVIALMLAGQNHFFRDGDHVCFIGLKPISSYPLLIYDLYINLFLTSLFLFPLIKTTIINGRTRRIARRALIATAIALTTSTTNIVILAVVGGSELGWLCLGSCGIDVIINALSLFWVTGPPRRPVPFAPISEKKQSPPNIPNLPTQTILKTSSPSPLPVAVPEAVSPMSSHYTPGPHPITNAYYRVKKSSHQADPFARATYMPKVPEPAVHISTDSQIPKPPSTLQSFTRLFRRDADERLDELHITVTTDIDIEVGSLQDSIMDAYANRVPTRSSV